MGNIYTYGNNTTGFSQLSDTNGEFYNRTLIEALRPELHFMKFGVKKPMPKNSGATVSFRKIERFAETPTAIVEGVIPESATINVTKVNAVVANYGNYTKTTDFLDKTGLCATTTELAEEMGKNAGETMDIVVRDVLAAGSNVLYAGGKANRNAVAATDKISYDDLLKIRRAMVKNHVKKINVGGKMRYVAFIHPDVALDLMNLEEYKNANTYVDNSGLVDGEIKDLAGFAFIETPNAPVFTGEGAQSGSGQTATSTDVYGIIFIGDKAYGIPDIDGGSKPEIIIHYAGEAGVSDPINQFNSVGWKALFTAVRLNEMAILRYECAATA